MARLRHTSPDQPGWTRRRAGRGFVYLDGEGARLADVDADRCRALVIPPAWQEVWICPVDNGHLQAVGTDDAGRRQYLYHPDWRTQRDQLKHDRVLRFGRVLSRAREQILVDLGTDGRTLERACATAVRLLDLGYFRIGNDVYADQHGSFGLTTLRRDHVRKEDGALVFRFVGKSEVEHHVTIDDPHVIEALEVMRRRRGGEQLLAWKDGRAWRELGSSQVNDYLRTAMGDDYSAKDFRTWHATVLAAAALAESDEPGTSTASRRRAVSATMTEVAEFLGNTPTLARTSYVDPRVVDAYGEGRTIAAAVSRRHPTVDERQAALERAVLRLLK